MNISPIRRFLQLAIYLILGLMLNSSRASAQDAPSCFQFFFPTLEAQAGDTVCLPLMVHHFDSISSMQFVVFWNPDELEYIGKDFSESALPNVMANFFGPVTTNRLPFAPSRGVRRSRS